VPKLRKETERSFIVKNGILNDNTTAELDQLQVEVESALEYSLGQEAIIQEVINPSVAILAQMVVSNMNKEDAIKLANKKIPSLFTQYAATRVDTTLQIYTREMVRIMSDAEGFEWFKYSGPVTPTALGNDIRPFCLERVKGIYIAAEISSWANLTWDGKIPSTNAYSVFSLLGGWQCRHWLTPVKSKDVPASAITRARRLGYI
jgi:hypothetical protein